MGLCTNLQKCPWRTTDLLDAYGGKNERPSDSFGGKATNLFGANKKKTAFYFGFFRKENLLRTLFRVCHSGPQGL